MPIGENDYLNVKALINEAALQPDRWIDVLKELGRLTGCVAGGLTIEDPISGRGNPIQYYGFDETHVERTWHHYLPMNPLLPVLLDLQPGAIITNGMIVPKNDFRRSEFFNGWAKPQGLCSPTTVVLHRSRSSFDPLTLVRPDGRDDVEDEGLLFIRGLLPPLIQAFDLTMRFQRLQSREAALDAALLKLSYGVFIMDENGMLSGANAEAERLIREDQILDVSGGKLRAKLTPITRMIEAAEAEGNGKEITEVHIPREGRRPLLATIIKTGRKDEFSRRRQSPSCIIVIADPEKAADPRQSEALAKAYNITPSEARILDDLLSGKDLGQIADELRLSHHTVRSHLKNIFHKTDVKRQSELIRLFLTTTSPFTRR